ncbi:MAG: ATP-binding protein [Phycisphaerae bacterium]|jgi:signal transduction histidine kinase
MNLSYRGIRRLGIGVFLAAIALTVTATAAVMRLSQIVADDSAARQGQTGSALLTAVILAVIGIGTLAAGIGAVALRLARRLEATDRELRAARGELQAGVEAGTAEIAAANEELQAEIAERIDAQNALQEERNLLRSLVDVMESMDVGLTIQDTEYNITYQNSFMQKHFSGLGQKCYKVYENNPRVCDGCPVRKALADGQPHRVERITPAPGGGVAYWDNTAHPIRNSAGEIKSCFEVVRNVTERRKLEQARERVIVRQGQLNRLQQLLLGPGELATKLQMITDRVVDIFDVELAYIWLVKPGDQCYGGCVHADAPPTSHGCRDRSRCLHLLANSERLSGVEGRERYRVPMGCCAIGRMAEGDEPKFVTNEAGTDPRIDDHRWINELKLTSVAAYRLRPPGGETIGVLALFSTRAISEEEDGLLESVGSTVAQVVQRARAEEELEVAHRRHREASRLAGMAEVATGVLHNIGNVLTSANVTVNLLRDKVRMSKVSGFARAVQLIQEHAVDLGEFVTADEKGRRLPAYLDELCGVLHSEQAGILEELSALTSNMDHIKTIVAAQQEYATLAGVTESYSVSEVVEQALHMSEHAFEEHEIEPVRAYEPVSDVIGDRQKLLQILVNLIQNADAALVQGAGADRQIVARVTPSGSDRVRIDIEDNGVGIPAENMTRIFAHGFTTRRDGHGFGLHHSALLARELGGILTAHSEGPGQGARFTLEIPFRRAGQHGNPADPAAANPTSP